MINLKWLLLGLVIPISQCKTEEKFEEIGSQFSGPTAIELDKDEEYFYVLNSDFAKTYDTGSLRILPTDEQSGREHHTVKIGRLGRAMQISGDKLLIAYGPETADEPGAIEIWDIAGNNKIAPKKIWRESFECTPLSIATAKNDPEYPYFAVSCFDGTLWMGRYGSSLEDTSITKSRDYLKARRAMFIDTSNDLLYAFPTNIGSSTSADYPTADALTYQGDDSTEGCNEVPDEFEKPDKKLRRNTLSAPYQFIVYDIAKEAQENFKFRELNSVTDPVANQERRWLYFNEADVQADCNSKHYRTNFFQAQMDLSSTTAEFYLSHRGSEQSPTANAIIKVSIQGDPRVNSKGEVPLLTQYFKFEKIYGSNLEVDSIHYPGDFEITQIGSVNRLVINHFRDSKNWESDERRNSIVLRDLENVTNSEKVFEQFSDDYKRSFYQVAVTKTGKILTGSYYGDSVILFDTASGTSLEQVKQYFD